MKVITGKFKGRIIKTPEGMETRPTKQRIRESIFNILENKFNFKDKVVADVFAGSGAFGLEAISRGAKKVYLFEKSMSAALVIKENFKNCDNYIIIKDALNHNVKETFDLLYFDPPYQKDFLIPAVTLFTKNKLIHDKTIIITETSVLEETNFEGLAKEDTRIYGKIKIDFFTGKDKLL